MRAWDAMPSEDPSRTFSASALPSWGGGIKPAPGRAQGRGGCLMAWEEERKDNSLMGTEPLLFKMDHTQLDKYCKNLQIFLFINPSVCGVHPSTTCGGFLFSSTCYCHRHGLLQRPSVGPSTPQLQSPVGGGERRGAWTASPAGMGSERGRAQRLWPSAAGTQPPNNRRCPGPLGSRDRCQLKTHEVTLIIPSSPRRPSAFSISAVTQSSPRPKGRASLGSVAGPGPQ